jgi:hypothetical protein
MSEIYEPKSDSMEGFDPETEKIIENEAGFADGSIGIIKIRVPLSPQELEARKAEKSKNLIISLEDKILNGTITADELSTVDALYKIKALKSN